MRYPVLRNKSSAERLIYEITDTPRMSVGHVLEARARSISSPRSQRPYLLKDSSLTNLSYSNRVLIAPYL